jgi:ATP-dependent Clp protease ATP-binding subunit ClpC
MFERFTNRACVVMQLAEDEARRLNHNYIGTEHILLGLVKEAVRTAKRPGLAAKVLKPHGILDLRKIRVEVEKVVHSGSDYVAKEGLPHTPQSRRVIEHAITEADRLDEPVIGTGFLLLGLLHEQESVASVVLKTLEVNLEEMRENVLQLLRKQAKK